MNSSDDRAVARRVMITIGLVLATALGLLVIYATRRVLIWIVIAAFVAVAVNPAVDRVQRRLTWCRRSLATLLVFTVVVLLLAGLMTAIVMPLAEEGAQLVDQLPQLAKDLRAGRGPVGGLVERFHLRQYVESHSAQIRQYVAQLGAPTLSLLRGAATTVVGFVTVVVLAYLMVLEAPRIMGGTLPLFAGSHAERVRRIGRDCARTVTGYLTGNLLISLICGGLTFIVLAALGVPYAAVIALLVAIADLIPLVGATLGAGVAVIAALFRSTTAGIVVLIFFIVYQQVENHLLQPLILSRTVRLNPLAVLVSILVAVELAGIVGALLAIPVAGIIQVIALDLLDRRGRSTQTGGEPPVPDAP